MSLLQLIGLKSKSTVINELDFAPSIQLMTKLENKAYLEIELLLKKSSAEMRDRLIYCTASHSCSLQIAQDWAGKHPNSVFANIFQGASLLIYGWGIRGGSYAEDVDDDAWADFFRYLEMAEDSFMVAAKLNPALPDPYAWLLSTGMGLDKEPSVIYKRFLEATNRDPLHFPAHYRYFPTTTEKWGGSHDEMSKFVRELSNETPLGSSLHVLMAMSYSELALSMREKGLLFTLKTLRKSNNAKECVNALYKWLDATPESIVEKLNQRKDAYAYIGLNHFGLALYLTGAFKEAYIVMQRLNGEISGSPWGWVSEGIKEEKLGIGFTFDKIYNEVQKKLNK